MPTLCRQHSQQFSSPGAGPAGRGQHLDHETSGMVKNASRVRTEVSILIATSWNLGQPELANRVAEEELLDLIYLDRPALANVHWSTLRGSWATKTPSASSPRTGPGGSATSAAPMKPSAGPQPLIVQSSQRSPESQQQLPSSKRLLFPKNSPSWKRNSKTPDQCRHPAKLWTSTRPGLCKRLVSTGRA
jgi:hypothetical protein